jgi:hypothetical protein
MRSVGTRSRRARSTRVQVLYRSWLRNNAAVMKDAVSPVLADAIARRAGQLETHVLSHPYLHLAPLVTKHEETEGAEGGADGGKVYRPLFSGITSRAIRPLGGARRAGMWREAKAASACDALGCGAGGRRRRWNPGGALCHLLGSQTVAARNERGRERPPSWARSSVCAPDREGRSRPRSWTASSWSRPRRRASVAVRAAGLVCMRRRSEAVCTLEMSRSPEGEEPCR